jgi:hypothetical protein
MIVSIILSVHYLRVVVATAAEGLKCQLIGPFPQTHQPFWRRMLSRKKSCAKQRDSGPRPFAMASQQS